MTERAYTSATELVAQLRRKEIGSLELCDYFIDRIERLDGDINALVVRDFDRARDAAQAADNAPANTRGPLHGLPMSIKESYNIAGLPTPWGIPDFKDILATEDAEMVKRYKAAGALFLGKTNVPLHLGDFQSYNNVYGTTNNPWDLARTPGGSSGGSAAALAAGLTGLESGSDIGGSIRNPAHFCGVYGHKPTWGVVPPQGHALPRALASPDIAVCGPLARSAEDLALAMDIIAGPEPLNRAGWQLNLPRPQKTRLSEFRVAIWTTDSMCPVDTEIENRVNALGELLEEQGASVSWQARPEIDLQRSHITYLRLLHSIMGPAAGEEAFIAAKASAAEMSDDDKSDHAVMMRAMVMEHRDWLRANNYREKLRYAWQAFFNDWDILLCPQMATTAFTHDHSKMSARTITVNGEPQDYFKQVFWSGLVTAPYLPSTVFPSGLSGEGLPIGIQAVGAECNDYLTIEFSRLLGKEIGGFQPPVA
ncbi:MAG: amidase [Pseudomonadales bacterium]